MKIWSNSFQHGARIPEEFAFGKYHPENHVQLSSNRNPHLAWSELPQATRSLALIVCDSDVPSKLEDANQEGKIVLGSVPRVDFYHWVLVDLAPSISSIEVGQFSDGITPRGKQDYQAALNTRQGINNYREWLAEDAEMSGDYYGYDGACPVWNDEIIHHYHFTLYATDLEHCPVEEKFTAPDVLKAIKGHILDQTTLIGTYSINPKARLLTDEVEPVLQ
ncbi:MAG: YbhB/YbcL family Raf kinase inhibitor-like protein [Cyanobacteria bacterium P01_G01_bin.39]